jgi:hypothetical protein
MDPALGKRRLRALTAGSSGARRRGSRSQARAFARFSGAFFEVSASIDDLEIRRAPKVEQLRPAVLAGPPNHEKWHAVIYLGRSEQPHAADGTAVLLQAFQFAEMIARRVPKIPGRYAAAVPSCPWIRTAIVPQIAMPAEAKYDLTANAALARTLGMCILAEGSRRSAKTSRPGRCFLRCAPYPAARLAAAPGQRAGEAICPHRVVAPVGIDSAPEG